MCYIVLIESYMAYIFQLRFLKYETITRQHCIVNYLPNIETS